MASQNVAVPIPGPGILMFGVGVFAAWLFATGRLDAVRTAIATGAAPVANTTNAQPATGALVAAPSSVSLAPSVAAAQNTFLAAYNTLQAGGLPSVQIRPDASGGLTADVGAAVGAGINGP